MLRLAYCPAAAVGAAGIVVEVEAEAEAGAAAVVVSMGGTEVVTIGGAVPRVRGT